jgi:hypothetical protein
MPLLPENYDDPKCCAPRGEIPCEPGNIPGPKGDTGTPGTNGTNGSNAFTETTLSFVVPAASANVTVAVGSTAWMAVGQIVFIASSGYYQVAFIQDSQDVQLTNLGYAGNAPALTVIAAGESIVAAGVAGAAGVSGGSVTSVNLSMPTGFVVTGGPVTTTGTLAVTTDPTTTANKFLASPSGTAGAPTFRAIVAADLPAVVQPTTLGGTGAVTASAGFNALSPITTKGDLITSQGTSNVRLAVGTNGQVLQANSAATDGIAWTTPTTPLSYVHRVASASPDLMLVSDSIVGVNVAVAASETLIAAPADGREVIIKDESGAANTNNITVYAGAGDTIQGASTSVISTAYGYRHLYYNAMSKVWFIIGSA